MDNYFKYMHGLCDACMFIHHSINLCNLKVSYKLLSSSIHRNQYTLASDNAKENQKQVNWET